MLATIVMINGKWSMVRSQWLNHLRWWCRPPITWGHLLRSFMGQISSSRWRSWSFPAVVQEAHGYVRFCLLGVTHGVNAPEGGVQDTPNDDAVSSIILDPQCLIIWRSFGYKKRSSSNPPVCPSKAIFGELIHFEYMTVVQYPVPLLNILKWSFPGYDSYLHFSKNEPFQFNDSTLHYCHSVLQGIHDRGWSWWSPLLLVIHLVNRD